MKRCVNADCTVLFNFKASVDPQGCSLRVIYCTCRFEQNVTQRKKTFLTSYDRCTVAGNGNTV